MSNMNTQLDLFNTDAMTVEQLIGQLDPDQRNDDKLWPRTMAELIDVVADYLDGLPLFDSSERSMELAQNVILVIANHLGARAIYLPRGDKLKRALRDAAIFRAFNGCNHRELAKKTGLTTAQIYSIIATQRQLRDDKQQMKLPFPE